MKNMIWRNLLTATGLALALSAAHAAGPLPYTKSGGVAGGPASGILPYVFSGNIDEVSISKNYIIVGDVQYTLPANLAVHYGKNQGSASLLKKGARIGFISSGDGQLETRVMTEVWILQ